MHTQRTGVPCRPGFGSCPSMSDGDSSASDSSAGDRAAEGDKSASSADGVGRLVDMAVVAGKVGGRLQHHFCALMGRVGERARGDSE